MGFRPIKKIFISYRREDSPGEAGRLYEDLLPSFGAARVFMDVAGIPGGANFRTAISDNLAGAGVLLAVIGPHWAAVTDAHGKRRLENPDDFVRQEIASALARGLPVIPVLVDRATMPDTADLPADLKALADRQGDELTLARWRSDFGVLLTHVEQYVPASPKPSERKWGRWIGVGGLGVFTLLALTVYGVVNRGGTVPQPVPYVKPADPDPPVTEEVHVAKKPGPVGKDSAVGAMDDFFAPAGKTNQAKEEEKTSLPTIHPRSSEAAASGVRALLGSWEKTGNAGDGIPIQFTIFTSSAGLGVRVTGVCGFNPCDWGTRSLSYDGVEGVAGNWPMPNSNNGREIQRNVTLTLRPESQELHVTLTRNWRDLQLGFQTSDQELEFTRIGNNP